MKICLLLDRLPSTIMLINWVGPQSNLQDGRTCMRLPILQMQTWKSNKMKPLSHGHTTPKWESCYFSSCELWNTWSFHELHHLFQSLKIQTQEVLSLTRSQVMTSQIKDSIFLPNISFSLILSPDLLFPLCSSIDHFLIYSHDIDDIFLLHSFLHTPWG